MIGSAILKPSIQPGKGRSSALSMMDGRTTLTVLVEHPTKEGRDAHINSGMEAGMQDAMDLLEEVAVSLR